MNSAAMPIFLVVVGLVWLLDSLAWMPAVQWVWIGGLAVAGISILMLDKITKSSIVAGPLLLLASALSYARYYHDLGWRFIIPSMLLAAGVLMLIARLPTIPESRQLNSRFERNAKNHRADE
tara:strand:+ start:148719 stop:149084 length:366 start_codon:yes stop_codon:yes gene_type:complete